MSISRMKIAHTSGTGAQGCQEATLRVGEVSTSNRKGASTPGNVGPRPLDALGSNE